MKDMDYNWIISNFDGINNAELCRRYNLEHGTNIDHKLFNWYCKKVGCVSRGRKYTDEEKSWIKENYPLLGQNETSVRFEEKFGRKVSPKTICKYYNKWLNGSGVSEERRKARYNSVSSPIGTLSVNCRGEAKVKTENGWIKATHLNINLPKGMIAFNLDKNIYDNSIENIGITTNSKFRALRNSNLWTEDRELTKIGLMCIELERLITDQSCK